MGPIYQWIGLPRDPPGIEDGGRDLEASPKWVFSKGSAGLWFFIPPYKFKIRVYLEGLLELHYGDPTTAARSLLMILVKLTKFIYDDPMGQ